MKLKRFFTFIFALFCALALCSCDDKKQTETPNDNQQTPGDNNSGNETPEDNKPEDEKPGEDTPTKGDLIVDAVKNQFAESETFIITIDQLIKNNTQNWRSDLNEYYSIEFEADAEFEIVAAKHDDHFDFKINYRTSEYETYPGSSPYSSVYSSETYIIDGYVYSQGENNKKLFYAEEMFDEEQDEIFDVIGQLCEGVEISQDDINALLEFISDFADQSFDITNNAISLGVDYEEMYNQIRSYVTSIDGETESIETVLNEFLAVIDPELTADALIDLGVVVGKMTVGEAYASIDEFLTENYQTTIQDIYDSIVGSEKFSTALEIILTKSEYTPEMIEEQLGLFKSLKIEEALSDVKDMVIYDLILMSMEAPEDESITIDELAANIKDMIAVPFNTAFPNFLDNLALVLDNFNFEEAYQNLNIEFNNLYQVKELSLETKFEFEQKTPNDNDTSKMDINSSYFYNLISVELSDDTTTIELPKDSLIINDPNSDVKFPSELNPMDYSYLFEFTDGIEQLYMYDESYGANYDGYIKFYKNSLDTYYIHRAYIKLDSVSDDKTIYTFSIDTCEIYYNNEFKYQLYRDNLSCLSTNKIYVIFDTTNLVIKTIMPTVQITE